MRTFVHLGLLATLTLVPYPAHPQTSPADLVSEYIGTANEGQTFPATGPPFAMTQWTPQTREGNVKCIAPYYFADTRIQGFRGSHFLSGSCTQDYGSMTIMPESGTLKLGAVERASSFSRSSEKATPYKYAVSLNDYDIDAEMTGASRSGLMRFRFRKAGKSWLLIECNSAKGEGTVQIDPQNTEITVVNPVRRLYAGNGKLAGFNGYFVVQFDHKFHVGGTWSGSQTHAGTQSQEGTDGIPGAYVSFDLRPGETLQARVGSSFTSLAEARRNLQSEIPNWSFEKLVAQTRDKWNSALNRIAINTDSAHKHIFYTAMYHSMLLPRIFSDVSGTYPGFAGEGKTEIAKDFNYYTDYSLWDTFRAVHPLLTMLDPDRERDMVKSLIVMGEQGGFLSIYPAWNSYTSEMIGDHAVAVIGDAYIKGIRGFDIKEAYQLMRKNAMELPPTEELYADGRGRRALKSYLQYGYIPLEDTVPDAFHTNEQVSRTLEYAYDDFVVGEVARAMGRTADADLFHNRAQNYRNVIDTQTGFARGRHADGSWDAPFDPTTKYPYITEGLPFQYTFFVPQDLPGLIDLVGGRDAFVRKLDALFAGGYYDHGNEPSHHIAYLYDNAGAAWKTQQHVRSVLETSYADTPSGLAGNDDCGQMSAWYVMSALGFYSVAPGTPVYQIGTPLFDDATIRLDSGKQFHIRAAGASSEKQYIRSATLNGVPLNRYWISHSEIVDGGELVFEMSSRPNPDWPNK
ncbi:MAG: GH92 family glycosyl hydrolase [Acidobacteriota bacterium]|nr:GH92 family glycosyl hydrolase [Acidobacteriota bacterium]